MTHWLDAHSIENCKKIIDEQAKVAQEELDRVYELKGQLSQAYEKRRHAQERIRNAKLTMNYLTALEKGEIVIDEQGKIIWQTRRDNLTS